MTGKQTGIEPAVKEESLKDEKVQIMTENELYHAALEKWGFMAQLRMLQEECGELVAEINHWTRRRGDIDPDLHLCEELADVEIMLQQIKACFYDKVEEQKKRKLQRLEERLKMGGTRCRTGC